MRKVIPFLLLGVVIAACIGMAIVFAYVFVWGLLIGAILWLLAILRNFLFSDKANPKVIKKKQGRVIEHDEK